MSIHRKPKLPTEFYAPLASLDRAALMETVYCLLCHTRPSELLLPVFYSPAGVAREAFKAHAEFAERFGAKPIPMPKALRREGD